MKNMIGVTLVGISVGWAGLANADPVSMEYQKRFGNLFKR